MNDENKFGKRIMIIMLSASFVLLIGVAVLNFIDSPKFYEPSFTENAKNSKPTEETVDFMENTKSSVSEDIVFPIEINSASAEMLQLIPDIGPATANLIIEYRNEQGTILEIEELLSIDGIGDKTIEVLKEFCIIN